MNNKHYIKKLEGMSDEIMRGIYEWTIDLTKHGLEKFQSFLH